MAMLKFWEMAQYQKKLLQNKIRVSQPILNLMPPIPGGSPKFFLTGGSTPDPNHDPNKSYGQFSKWHFCNCLGISGNA
jgi:hypothetical protein